MDGPHLKQSYKLSVQLGNNGHLVKSIMKTRQWWLHHQEQGQEVNFLWTNNRQKDVLESLKTCLVPLAPNEDIEKQNEVAAGKEHQL